MKDNKTIQSTIGQGLCCSCGICAGACPKDCITMSLKEGVLLPELDEAACVRCGICYDVCPGKEAAGEALAGKQEPFVGHIGEAFIGRVNDEGLLKATASGGICTWLIQKLLQKRIYDCAFCVDSFDYSNYLKSKKYILIDSAESIGRSRYVAVSHEDAAKHMVSHRNDKVILVGTSCAISGFTNLIERFKLDARNYLLIGLFCDKMMTYNVWDYFSNKATAASGRLRALFFRSKDKSGWPGDMKLVFDNATEYLAKRERLAVKDFFCNRRCLYCTDKLNCKADISLGDNYTGTATHPWGSSCILVRTDKVDIRRIGDGQLDLVDLGLESLAKSQEIAKKNENVMFLKMHLGLAAPPLMVWLKYYYKLLKISVGGVYGRFPFLLAAFSKIESKMKHY